MDQTIASIKKLPYDERINYAELVVEHAKNNRYWNSTASWGDDTLRTVQFINDPNYNPPGMAPGFKNILWFNWHKTNLLTKAKIAYDKALIASLIDSPDTDYMFITIGFDDNSGIDYPIMQKLADKVCLLYGGRWAKKVDYVCEKNRATADGTIYHHHHIHLLVIINEYQRKSKVIEGIMKIRDMKKYVRQKEFIDIKTPKAKEFDKRAQPYAVCYNYVKGLKTSAKTNCLQLDKEWREGYETCVHYPTYEPNFNNV